MRKLTIVALAILALACYDRHGSRGGSVGSAWLETVYLRYRIPAVHLLDVADVELIAQTALPSTAILSAFPNPAFPDQPVTLTATVTVPGGFARGTVVFYETLPKEAGRSIGSADLDEHGVARISHTWPDVGTRWVFASYPGGDQATLSFSNTIVLTTVPRTTRRRSAGH